MASEGGDCRSTPAAWRAAGTEPKSASTVSRGGQPSCSRPFQSAGAGGRPRKNMNARIARTTPARVQACFFRLGRRGSLSWSCGVRPTDRPQRRQVSPSRSGRAQRQARANPACSLMGRGRPVDCCRSIAWNRVGSSPIPHRAGGPRSRTTDACANTLDDHDPPAGREIQPLSSDRESRLAALVPAVSSGYVPDRMAVDRTLAQAAASGCGSNRGRGHRCGCQSSRSVGRYVPWPARRSRPGEQAAGGPSNPVPYQRRAPEPGAADPALERATFDGGTSPLARHGPPALLLAHVARRHDLRRADPSHRLPASNERLARRREPGLGHASQGEGPPDIAGVDDQSQPPEGPSHALIS
jgi:hypothetical protein